MRTLFITLTCLLCACNQAENKLVDETPPVDIAPQRAQLQKAKELEAQLQQDAHNRRKAIENQPNSQ